MVKVGVVDYGLGNVQSVVNALTHIDVTPVVDTDGRHLDDCAVVIVPGVATFATGLSRLRDSGQADALAARNIKGDSIVGLCLGAQMFLDVSEESPGVQGLGLAEGRVVALNPECCRVPRQGWFALNGSMQERDDFLRGGISRYFYFSHGYRCEVGSRSHELASVEQGTELVTAVYRKDNVIGVQFHPERSGAAGLEFLDALLR